MKAWKLVLILALLGQACMSGPRLVRDRPGDYLEANAPPQAGVTLVDGSHLIIEGPRVISDTVFGWTEGEEIAIPATDLEQLRVRKLSIFRSAVMPTLAVGGAVAAIILTRRPVGEPPEDGSQLGACEDNREICVDR